MTTLAIVGDGLASRSLVYHLTERKNSFTKILVFGSDSFAPPCSLNSTAIASARGVTEGHSPLGDLIVKGMKTFTEHVQTQRPNGVWPITQVTGSSEPKARFPGSTFQDQMIGLGFSKRFWLSSEMAFLIDPPVYLEWLRLNSKAEYHSDYVIGLSEGEIRTQSGKTLSADKIIVAGGAPSRFFHGRSKPSQGAYLEYQVDLNRESFSLSLDGKNLVYRSHSKVLLVGNTTAEANHYLAPVPELREIHNFLADHVSLQIPAFDESLIKVGLREKARKREPYCFTENGITYIGGLYKNGFSLALEVTRGLADQLV